MNNAWENFGKYIGVQGLMALTMVGGFVFANLTGRMVSSLYTELMTLIIGFYFAKNGVSVLERLKDILTGKNVKEAVSKKR